MVTDLEKAEYQLAGIFGIKPRHYPDYSKKSGEGAFVPRFTAEELEYWQGEPPEEIVIATGSYRKALLVAYELTGLVRPAFDRDKSEVLEHAKGPLNFQDFLYTQVRNGNGSVSEKTLVGYFMGVPVFIDPSQETSSNEDAVKEAEFKIRYLIPKYKNRNVLLIATDSVTLPSGQGSPLGKPENEPDFDKETFNAVEYVKNNYKKDSTITQYNGLAFLFTKKIGTHPESTQFPNEVAAAMRSWLSTLTVTITEEVYNMLLDQAAKLVSIDASGGGILQDTFPFEDLAQEETVRQLYDPESAEKLLQVLTELRQWYAYDSIAGLGWWDIIAEIEKYLQK